jgi:hypothetical protein
VTGLRQTISQGIPFDAIQLVLASAYPHVSKAKPQKRSAIRI